MGGSPAIAAAGLTMLLPGRPAAAAGVVINEIYYHDPDHPGDEFVEVWNTGPDPVDLSDWSFTDGIAFTFPAGALIASGQHAVVAADPSRRAGSGQNTPLHGLTCCGSMTAARR